MRRESFSRKSRILKSKEFEAASRKGRKITSGSITVLYIDNSLSRHRVGLTVSKKISKRAVDRNRIKRWSREVFRKYQQNLRGSLDIVIIARPRALELTFSEFQESLVKLLDRI